MASRPALDRSYRHGFPVTGHGLVLPVPSPWERVLDGWRLVERAEVDEIGSDVGPAAFPSGALQEVIIAGSETDETPPRGPRPARRGFRRESGPAAPAGRPSVLGGAGTTPALTPGPSLLSPGCLLGGIPG